jgi:hypothetical protein
LVNRKTVLAEGFQNGWQKGEASMVGKRILGRSILVAILCLTFVTAAAADRFVDNGDGTVTDTKTGLMWAQTDNFGNITWQDAKLYCENIILSTHNNWRMPTIKELETLFDSSLGGYETICGHKVKSAPQVELSCGFVWSSDVPTTTGGYAVEARAFNYKKGYQYTARKTQYRGYRALAVRKIE